MQTSLFPSLPEPPGKLLVQRNDLINARFKFSTLEMRLFTAMLARIKREDTEFYEMRIPIREVIAITGRRPSSNDYQQLEETCEALTARIVSIRRTTPPKRRRKRQNDEDDMGDFEKIPLMSYVKYGSEEGVLLVRFNDPVREHLLQLNEGNFTQVELLQLLKLKCAHSYRIYWLLKQHADFGSRTFSLAELKTTLGLDDQYPNFPMFRARVLDVVEKELAKTNLAFSYNLRRNKRTRAVEEIVFSFPQAATNPIAQLGTAEERPAWMEALRSLEVSEASMQAIAKRIDTQEFDPDYVLFVVNHAKKRKETGKIATLAGYIVDAIKNEYQLPEYLVRRKKRLVARQPKEKEADSVIIGMSDVQAGYALAVKRQQTTETFERYLDRIYLSQGFQLKTNQAGQEVVVKLA